MIRLHKGSGSWEIQLLGDHLPAQDWIATRENVYNLLKARKRPGTGLLDMFPWELRDGTNFFADEFSVLYASLPIDRYVKAAELEHNQAALDAASSIVSAFEELGLFVRLLRSTSPQNVHMARIVSGIATILDALNPIRNNASVAHPNENLLTEIEAMLVVNSARTLLHFLDGKTRGA